MAEVALGLLSAAATVGAAQLTTGSGFARRHESTHREETMEMRRNMEEFLANVRGGDVTQEEEREFLRTRDECVCLPSPTHAKAEAVYNRAIQRQNEYHEIIQSYKGVSRFNIPEKLKKRGDVRRVKQSIRETNHALRNLNEVRCCSDAKKATDK
jgi:hypothetical protein